VKALETAQPRVWEMVLGWAAGWDAAWARAWGLAMVGRKALARALQREQAMGRWLVVVSERAWGRVSAYAMEVPSVTDKARGRA